MFIFLSGYPGNPPASRLLVKRVTTSAYIQQVTCLMSLSYDVAHLKADLEAPTSTWQHDSYNYHLTTQFLLCYHVVSMHAALVIRGLFYLRFRLIIRGPKTSFSKNQSFNLGLTLVILFAVL